MRFILQHNIGTAKMDGNGDKRIQFEFAVDDGKHKFVYSTLSIFVEDNFGLSIHTNPVKSKKVSELKFFWERINVGQEAHVWLTSGDCSLMFAWKEGTFEIHSGADDVDTVQSIPCDDEGNKATLKEYIDFLISEIEKNSQIDE